MTLVDMLRQFIPVEKQNSISDMVNYFQALHFRPFISECKTYVVVRTGFTVVEFHNFTTEMTTVYKVQYRNLKILLEQL